jgi:pyruvate ferredoxin oxidoreductase alpha subunit
MEMRYQLDRVMESSRQVIKEVDSAFAKRFGRGYGGLFEAYRMDDAEYALLALGTATSTARAAVDELREDGKRVGLIKLRFMRPFPHDELLAACKDLKALGVFDRSLSFNRYGPVFTEVRNSLHELSLPITDHVGGLGGRDLTLGHMREIFANIERSAKGERVRTCSWYGLRGEQE